MRQKNVGLIVVSSLLAFTSHNALACKMSPIGGSAQAITAIVAHIAVDSQQQERTIKRITQEKPWSWTYVVETIEGENNCRAVGYEVIVDPSCKITVQSVPKKFSCIK